MIAGKRGGCRGAALRAALAAWAVLAAPAAGDVVNGNFEATPPLAGWTSQPLNPPGDYIEGIFDSALNSTVAHLHAEATYTYEQGQWSGDLGQAWLFQAPIVTQANEYELRLDARSTVSGLEVGDPAATVTVGGGGGGGGPLTGALWTAYTFPIVDGLGQPIAPGSMINVLLEITANKPASPGYEGQQVTQTLDLYVDNVHLVPLPGPAIMLALGAAWVLRRR